MKWYMMNEWNTIMKNEDEAQTNRIWLYENKHTKRNIFLQNLSY